MAKLRINGDSSGYVDLEAPNAASSSTLDLDQVPQKNATTTAFTGSIGIGETSPFAKLHVSNNQTGRTSADSVGNLLVLEDYENGMSILSANAGAGYILFGDQADTAAGAIAYDHSADRLRFRVNSSWDKMVINASGHVTKPQQPGFHVSNTTTPSGSTFTDGHNTVLKFDYVNSNVGSGWNTSTYRYTAPISGRYMIYGQARFDGITTYARVYVSVNGNSGWWSPGLHVISTQHPPSGGELWSGTVQGILPLSAGDYIELKGGGNNSVGTHQGEGSFGAYLLG